MGEHETAALPRLKTPPGASDCHIHIYGPRNDYPLAPTHPYPPPLATVAQYRDVMARLGIERVVVVQPAAYGTDNCCTMDAIGEFGAAARAIVVITPDTPRAEVKRLHDLGARGARFFMLRGAVVTWDMLTPVARLIADFGWNVQLQFDGRDFPRHEQVIRSLPCTVVIDHIGKFLVPVQPSDPAMQALMRLLDTGHVWVKASAPYETSQSGAPFYEDVGQIARALIQGAPERIVWASNWPHGGREVKPADAELLDLLLLWAPDEACRHRIFVDNPAKLYGFGVAGRT